jgi:hypothetical protein
MSAKTKTTETEALETILTTPPPDWRDPDGDGRSAPKQAALSWSIALLGGTARRWNEELTVARQDLVVQTRKREIHGKRGEIAAERDAAGMVETLTNKTIPRLEALVAAAGPWTAHNIATLKNALDEAVMALDGAEASLANHESARYQLRPDIFASGKVALAKERDKAEAAYIRAKEEYDELLARLEKDRDRLAVLAGRRVA